MMINIKRLFLVPAVLLAFLTSATVNAQKVNQFDANKKRTGVWKKYYKNKRIRYEGQFKDGKEVGTFKFYDMRSSSFPTAIREFHADSDSVSVRYFFLDGKVKTKGMFFGRKRVGSWLYYYKKGTVMSEEFYKDGKLSDTLKIYYPNGKLTEAATYVAGKLHGISRKYSDDGVLIEEVHYLDGKENGEAKYFELNGNLKEKGIYKNGKRVGKWEFYMNGEIADPKKRKELQKVKIKN